MSDRELNVHSALGRIASSLATERKDGLADLEHIFRHNKNSYILENLKDKTWHSIYEAIFQCANLERSNYLKSSHSQKTKSSLISRLTACGRALRITLTAGIQRIRIKTVKALLDHILQTLPMSDGDYLEGLSHDYVKCLRIISEYQPHVEHLRDKWHVVIDFCLEGVAVLQDHQEEPSSLPRNGSSTTSLRTPTVSLSRRSRAGTPQALRNHRQPVFRKEIDDLVACIRHLASSPNAPLLDKAELILTALIQYLKASDTIRMAHYDSFCAINSILSRITNNSIAMTQNAMLDLYTLIKDIWLAKSSSLKDEMLVTLILTKGHVWSILQHPSLPSFKFDLENLLETLQADYSKRLERDQLQLDDLRLSCYSSQTKRRGLDFSVFGLRRGNIRSESHWTILHLTAYYVHLLDSKTRYLQNHIPGNKQDDIRKRPRLSFLYQDTLRLATIGPISSQISALKTLAFLSHLSPLTEDQIDEIITPLTTNVTDSDGSVSSWAMIAIASCAFQKSSRASRFTPVWIDLFNLATRTLASSFCSRAASHLLNVLLKLKLVRYASIAPIVETMLSSIELHGPARLSDSSASLWVTLMQARSSENPSASSGMSERILHWVFSKWTPSSFDDRNYATNAVGKYRPADIIDLLYACSDRDMLDDKSPYFACHGSLAQAWQRCAESTALTGYLLLTDDNAGPHLQEAPNGGERPHGSSTSRSGRSNLAADILILESCCSETERVIEKWSQWMNDRPQNILPEMMIVVASLCIVNDIIASQRDERNKRRLESLRLANESLVKMFSEFLALSECDQEKIDPVLDLVSDHLPDFTSLRSMEDVQNQKGSIMSFALHLSKALNRRRISKQLHSSNDVDDFMELDDGFDSQVSEGKTNNGGDARTRDRVATSSDIFSFRSCVAAYTQLMTFIFQLSVESMDTDLVTHVPSAFIQHLISLPPLEFCACRPLLSMLFSTSFPLRSSDVELVSDHIASEFLEVYEYERHEIVLIIELDLLKGCASQWTDVETEAYEWFINKALPMDICSSDVQLGIVDLFFCLLHIQGPEYKPLPTLPSVRTGLFSLLSTSNIAVKYHISEHIAEFFNYFTLSEHEAVFEDVYKSLPEKEAWKEGMALRLLVLARLGSAWHTLLRRCVYHIFETAGVVEHSGGHAMHCISVIANTLNLGSSQQLFRLFASQLLYTWLGLQSVELIPYAIFSYPSLGSLLEDVQDEVFAQVLMRGKDEDITSLSAKLGSTTTDLLKVNFAKAAAYCLAWDTDKGGSQGHSASEAKLRALLDKRAYIELLQHHFPSILGIFLYTIDQEPQIEKAFSKRPSADKALAGLKDMQNISASDQALPADQQPLFRSKYLMDRIERLGRRVGLDGSSIWSPAIYTFVLRMLLCKIHPALGSLHACSVVRKIRILVALSGSAVFSHYPLEMTLHGLLTFLTDKQCAEDSLGIVQYLFSNGMTYLTTQISFVTGIVLSTLISLRKFVGSSQESTTQESQHRATMTKAQGFRKWLVDSWSIDYAKRYGDPDPNLNAYLPLIQAAAAADAKATAMEGMAESQVLRQMLDDHRSGRNLLKGSSRDLAFGIFCSDFASPPSYRNDILGHDMEAARFAAEVWASCQHEQISPQYLLWVARVIGRAHNANGWTTGFSKHALGEPDDADPDSTSRSSKRKVLDALTDLLFSSNHKNAGLAEETLRAVLLRTTSTEELAEVQELLPGSVVSALTLMTTDVTVALKTPAKLSLDHCLLSDEIKPFTEWIRDLTVALASACSDEPFIGALQRVIFGVSGLAETLFAPILHLVIIQDLNGPQRIRQIVSDACRRWFKISDDSATRHIKCLLGAILYLRKQPYPRESSNADRLRWLDLDYAAAAEASEACGMHTTALLLTELSISQPTKSSRRSSILLQGPPPPDQLLRSIFKNLDEPDSFYGVQQHADLSSVLDRLDYESDGFKGLLFRGARLDSQMRRHQTTSTADAGGLIRSLISLNLNALTHTVLSNQSSLVSGMNTVDPVLHTAKKLEQWDIRAPDYLHTESNTLFKVFQGISNSTDLGAVRRRLDSGFMNTIQPILSQKNAGQSMHKSFRTLGILAEIDDIMTSISPENLRDAWKNIQAREERILTTQPDDVRSVSSARETLFSTLSNNTTLRDAMHLSLKDVRDLEVQALLSSCITSRKHNALQESLAAATYLSDLVPACLEIGLNIDVIAQNEVADVLWDQGEHATSIRMLKGLAEPSRLRNETTGIHKARLLAKLGHHVAEARLEQPDEIMNSYLMPAITELKGQTKGIVAGQVFHQFASFCDNQLRNPDVAEDFNRVQKMRDRRKQELDEYEKTIRSMKSGQEKSRIKHEYRKSEKWYKLDNHEYERLRRARESFMTQSLENYLLSLSASDAYDNDVLRFFSIWLEFADTSLANSAVSKHLGKVPSAKFARLMNQLSSRLQNDQTSFQNLLSKLILRIATEHPYHAMHHIAAGTNSLGVKDDSAKSRLIAAKNISAALKSDKKSSAIWHNISTTDQMYHNLAVLNDKGQESVFKAGRELRLEQFPISKSLYTKIKEFKVPPPTMSIEVRADIDYSRVPRIIGFRPKMRIANGLSAPKILTANCSDGQSFKQLFKGGHDDLRQDAIMEQVFEEVSKLLGNHTATRQRNLRIRTYKVLPLSAMSGIMEFVQNTIAMHDVLIPLHETYFPKDLKSHQCRNKVYSSGEDSLDVRTKVFKEVTNQFHPVMRFFFLEKFPDPDEWFEKRLAYTRSTAAISILGHIVGLGDRHLHNILLDEYSGEVVHIDLGVAFEAGRVLPVPEVVPFRLSRDFVDGMGYTKTEGVFRRCCEFTLDALREERESIMTLLNVLRYDPLYSWTVSPLKAKRLQETEDERGQMMDEVAEQASKRNEEDAGEAGRALTVVEKKLSKTLSTAATVSALIAQATDERNLAVLFAGWSAWV